LVVEKDFPEQISSLHCRKRKNTGLSPEEEQEHNKSYSVQRMVKEHTICRLKMYKIMNDVFRNRLRKYNRILEIVSAGLVTYRIMNH
jgi:hypothetical protein